MNKELNKQVFRYPGGRLVKDLPSDRKVLVKTIRNTVASALCEINWALSLLARFFFLRHMEVWVQYLEADAEHGMSDSTSWLEIGLWGFFSYLLLVLTWKNKSSGMRQWNKLSGHRSEKVGLAISCLISQANY